MFEYKIELSKEELNDFKEMKKVLNNQGITEETEKVLSKYFTIRDGKTLKNYKKRKDGIGNYINDKELVKYMRILNFYVYTKIKKERERATKFLYNEKESEKAGFVDETAYRLAGKKIPKQTDKQIEEWADKAYPKLELEQWELEFNKTLLGFF